jgi:hypothetical protein
MTAILAGLLLISLVVVAALVIALGNASKRVAAASTRERKAIPDADARVAQAFEEAAAGLAEAQKLLDARVEQAKQDVARTRQHYLDEAKRIQAAASAKIAKLREEIEPLRRFGGLRNAEVEAEAKLSAALAEANHLTADAAAVLLNARRQAAEEISNAARKVKDVHEQADVRLDQATRDAGKILADAEKRALDVAGDAYVALQDKRAIEQAATAMRNIVDGYGDRYLVPTQTLLDALAIEYGYDTAAQSLASARERSRRMVEQGQAADCDYAEANRKATAIRFVIHAFNGSVDSILTKVKTDNFGVLEQRIRDAFSTTNLEGAAFRNARILPAYLDARIAELKWAVVVQELAQRDREEQRYLKEQERDQRKAEQERLKQLNQLEKQKQEAEKERTLRQAILAEAESRLALAKSEHEKQEAAEEVERLRSEVADVSAKLEEATRRELTIAQQTRQGSIYIISNLGSFGAGVYKIGFTRRAADERVDELSGASVPFDFDILGVIKTDNAPALEYKIHQQFLPARINKVNLRKEFFRVDLEEIRKFVNTLTQGVDILGQVIWTEKAQAEQYRESQRIENDAAELEKWLGRSRAIAERKRREETRMGAARQLIEPLATPDAGWVKEPA